VATVLARWRRISPGCSFFLWADRSVLLR